MTKNRIIILDDTCKQNFGGTSLTLKAIAESLPEYEFVFVETGELNKDLFFNIPKDSFWVLGNTLNLNSESVKILFNILLFRKFAKIEFDYGFCKYRCEQGFKKFTEKQVWEPFGESGSKILQNIYDLIVRKACKIFYMSEAQKEIHSKILGFKDDRQIVLGSCFSAQDLMRLINFKMQREKPKEPIPDVYAIVDGNGGWHSEAKGFRASIDYAKKNNLKFQVLRESNYEVFIQKLAHFKGLIFLPIIHDTCPRLVIEAKMLDMDLIINDNCQHIKEDWFSLKTEDMANYLLERPNFFRKEVNDLL